MTASATVPIPHNAKNPPAAGHISAPGHSQTASTQILNNSNQNSSTSSQSQGAAIAQTVNPGQTLAQPEPTQTTNSAPANTEASDENNLVLKAITTISEHKKPIVKWANYFQAAANALSFISKFPFLSKIKNFGDKLGEAGTKLFFLVNGGINAFQQFQYKNYTGFLGYLVYVANGLFVPQDNIMMMNGLGVGLTQWVNMANNALKDEGHKGQFSGIGDHLRKLFRGTAKIIKDSWRNPVKAATEGKPILGLTGAFMALYGVLHWALTGSVKVGKLFRSVMGGAALDGEQILGHQLKYKRENYAKSGITYIVGTALDYVREYIPSLNKYLLPLSFLFDGFGRYYQGVSEQNNEQSNAHLSKQEIDAIDAKHQSPAKPSYMSMLTDLFKGWFNIAKAKVEDATIVANAGHKGEPTSAAT
jgi:hypothetical protein